MASFGRNYEIGRGMGGILAFPGRREQFQAWGSRSNGGSAALKFIAIHVEAIWAVQTRHFLGGEGRSRSGISWRFPHPPRRRGRGGSDGIRRLPILRIKGDLCQTPNISGIEIKEQKSKGEIYLVSRLKSENLRGGGRKAPAPSINLLGDNQATEYKTDCTHSSVQLFI